LCEFVEVSMHLSSLHIHITCHSYTCEVLLQTKCQLKPSFFNLYHLDNKLQWNWRSHQSRRCMNCFLKEEWWINFLSRDCGSFHYLIGIFILSKIKIKWLVSKENFKTLLKLNLFFTFNLMLGTTCTYHVASYFLLTKFFQLILILFQLLVSNQKFPYSIFFHKYTSHDIWVGFFNITYIHHK